MFVRSGAVVVPCWSVMVRGGPAILNCLKLPCSSGAIWDGPGDFIQSGVVRGGPCSDRVGSGTVRSGTVLIRGDPG